MEFHSVLEALHSIPMTVLFFILPLLSLSLLTYLRRKPKYPPGPTPWPVIGNMTMMDQLTHRGLAELAKQHGGFFHLRIFFHHMFVVSSPEIARQVLQVQDNIFSNRTASTAIRYLTYDFADMAFANYGPSWRQMRKLCALKLFSRKKVETWESVKDEVDSMIKTAALNMNSPVNLSELVLTLSWNIIYRAVVGSSVSRPDQGQDEFEIETMQEYSELFFASHIADFIPWLGWVDPQGLNKRLVKARASLDGFIDKIIDNHMQKKKKQGTINGSSDEAKTTAGMVDELLAFYSDEAKVSESDDLQICAIKLTRDNIKAIIMDVMFGGTETVASAIEWVLAELVKNPEDLKRVQQELDDVVGLNRRAEEADFDKLTFLKCVLKETLRLHPPIPVAAHETAEDAVVDGYDIPARSRVMINIWAIGRDPKSWKDPNTFRPSRFLEENVPNFKGSNFEFIPFGSGRRSCPGMQLGLYELEMAVAHLLHCFMWELPDKMSPSELDMSDALGVTARRATRLVAVPTPRLLCPIY